MCLIIVPFDHDGVYMLHLLLIILKINIQIRRDNGAYGDDVNGIIVIQSSTSIQNSEEVVGYNISYGKANEQPIHWQLIDNMLMV